MVIVEPGPARLSGLDTAFLCLESAGAPMHLGGLGVFQPGRPVPPDPLYALLCDRAERIARLRWRLDRFGLLPAPPVWVTDRRFDVRRHVHAHRLPDGDHDRLATLAGSLLAEPLDLGRPPWQLHLVTGLTGGRFAVLLKVHHALADGLRALEVGMGLLDGWRQSTAGGPATTGPATTGPATSGPATSGPATVGGSGAAQAASGDLLGWLGSALTGAADALPRRVREVAGEAGTAAGIAAAVLSRMRFGGDGAALDRLRPHRPAPGPDPGDDPGGGAAIRGLALVRLDLADLRRVRSRFGGTDNDVLLAVLAGALHDWLAGQERDAEQNPEQDSRPGQVLDRRGENAGDLRVLVPVSGRRPPGRTGIAAGPDGRAAGNLLSGYLCSLPVTEPDPVVRLRAVRAAMERNKAAGPARGAGAFPMLAERVPAVLHRLATPLARRGAGRLFDAVVTNVPLPALPLTLAGAPLHELFPVAPLAHGQPLAVALSRYQGTVHVGLHADRRAVPDLDRLADALPAALTELVKAADAPRVGT